MKYGLKEDNIATICSVFSTFPLVDRVILYGSRAKGTYKTGSDIDLCVVGKNLSQNILYRIDSALDDLFLPYSFDLTLYHEIENQDLKDHIDRVGLIFYEKESS